MAYAIGIRSIVICHREYTISCCNVYNDFSDRFCVCSVITQHNWNHLGHLHVTNNDILREEKIPEMCVIWHGFRLIWVVIMFCYYFLFCYLYCSLDAKKSLICLAGKWIETWRDTYRLSQLLIPNSNTKIILQNHNHKVSDYFKYVVFISIFLPIC